MKTSGDALHAHENEHDFLLDALGGSHFNAKSDKLLEFIITRAAEGNPVPELVE